MLLPLQGDNVILVFALTQGAAPLCPGLCAYALSDRACITAPT